jgi:hypothetical protein
MLVTSEPELEVEERLARVRARWLSACADGDLDLAAACARRLDALLDLRLQFRPRPRLRPPDPRTG